MPPMEKRPTLNDPAEFALIRKIYFEKNDVRNSDVDPIERLERMEKHKTTNHAR